MTKQEANDILNAVRDGCDVPQDSICAALQMTGDIEDETDDAPILQLVRPVGTWERRRTGPPPSPFDGLLAGART